MIALDAYGTLVVTSLVLLFGRKLVAWIPPLRAYSIPEPVAGGLVAAIFLLVIRKSLHIEVEFDSSLKDPLMLAFFSSLGLGANLGELKKGGSLLWRFLLVVVGFLFVQNTIGIIVAKLVGLNPLVGLIAGSVTLSGGHGTGMAWGQVFEEKYGLQSAAELAMACATFGLVLGGLIGGPVARFLIRTTQTPGLAAVEKDAPLPFEQPQAVRLITVSSFIETLALVAVSLSGGAVISAALQKTAFALPTFVCCLFVALALRNILSLLGWYDVFDRAVSLIGNVSLSLFLAMALMGLKLWELSALAVPLLVLLVLQSVTMAAYAHWVTFRAMGKNYDAAVLAAGHCGFGLGATPTAVANMQAITDRFGPSHVSFLLVPMVGAFFIDISNAIVIKLFLALPFF
ncbi:MAG: sodium/glutamate symporter [Puniceicoccales bacterium]|jgi:ESS family glutamate:Na+ symporter|nr:sodium/glutamate symporter [Puniceicoccales bacterium]